MSDIRYSVDDDFADDGRIYEHGSRRRLGPLARSLVVAAICLVVAAFGGLVWFAYVEGVRNGAEDAAPVLRADAQPVKRKPADAGGMEIPHQDKLVFDRIAPSQALPPVERLLPPPETPLARPVAPVNATPAEPPASGRASDTTQQQVSPTASPVPGESASSSARADASPAPTAPVASVAPPTLLAPRAELPDSIARAPEPPDPETLAETPARDLSEIAPAAGSPTRQATVAPPAPASASQAPAGPAWRIQLASLTSETRAQAELQRMQQANTDVLGGLALNVEQANLAKGTYYRIQAGPLADRGAATDLCTKLKARKLDCLVVAP